MATFLDVVVMQCVAKHLDVHSLIALYMTCKRIAGTQKIREQNIREKLIDILCHMPAGCHKQDCVGPRKHFWMYFDIYNAQPPPLSLPCSLENRRKFLYGVTIPDMRKILRMFVALCLEHMFDRRPRYYEQCLDAMKASDGYLSESWSVFFEAEIKQINGTSGKRKRVKREKTK